MLPLIKLDEDNSLFVTVRFIHCHFLNGYAINGHIAFILLRIQFATVERLRIHDRRSYESKVSEAHPRIRATPLSLIKHR